MPRRLFGDKPLPEPMIYCKLASRGPIWVTYSFSLKKNAIWKSRLQNGDHFVRNQWVNRGATTGWFRGCESRMYPHEARLLASRQRTLKSVNCSLPMSLVIVVVDDLEPRPIMNSMAFEQMWQPMRQQRFGCMLDAELGGKSLSKLMIIVSNYELMRGNDHGLMSRITQYPVKTYTTHTTTQHSTTQHTYSHVF